VAGNWKMNSDRASAVRLALDVHAGCAAFEGRVEVAVCPPFVYLDAVARSLAEARSKVVVGAQNVYFQPSGAFTGEVSAGMVKDCGARVVIVGHSERRHVLGESDEMIHKKVRAVLEAGLGCILCVGETIEERRAGRTDEVNERQVRSALAGLAFTQASRVTIAYEPVWAIGTGQTASPADAQDAHAKIRRVVASLHGPQIAGGMRIQYGGSVKADNARELFAQADVDGGLIGGASLKAADFEAIVRSAA
jgi:triosephosphate isomerase